MSDLGNLQTGQLTPELLMQWQQMQDMQKRQQMAQSLMGQQADPRTAYSGLSNAGGSILGALAANSMAAKDQKKAYDAAPPVTATLPYGDGQSTTLSTKLPYMGPKPGLFNGMGSLFSFGGKS